MKKKNNEYQKAIIVLLIAILLVLAFKEENIDITIDLEEKDFLILPSENMIKNSKPEIPIEIKIPTEIRFQMEEEFINNHPNETLICLKGYVNNNTYFIENLNKGEIWYSDEYQVNGKCDDETLIQMHTHTNQSYDSCKPSYYDLALNKNIIEGLVCGVDYPEKILFYDSYGHLIELKEIRGKYYVYRGKIDANPFQPVYLEL